MLQADSTHRSPSLWDSTYLHLPGPLMVCTAPQVGRASVRIFSAERALGAIHNEMRVIITQTYRALVLFDYSLPFADNCMGSI